jgi:NADPH-dependent glutamate synthase beta subunit-like oxidoreductase
MNKLQNPGKSVFKVDPAFKHKLRGSSGGETLRHCYQCGACSAVCPIAKFIGAYRPNKIIELAKLGIRGMPQSNAFLFCSACSLCTKGCPQNVRVHELMQALKDLAATDADVLTYLSGGFNEALEALSLGMPFPVIYSWICLRPPGKSGGSYDDMIKAALDCALKAMPEWEVAPCGDPKRVAVVGSGPAGLTAAWALAKAGHGVTVLESHPVLGGMLRTGLPDYRLPKDLVDAEIDKLRSLGIEMLTNTPVDNTSFDKLIRKGDFAAVFVATGACTSRKLRVEGEELSGVIPALDFLKEYNTAGKAPVGKNVVVIGGGNVATDSAGAALRCGAESVKLFCLEDRKTMPAHEWEIEEAAADGVEICPSWGPAAINGDGTKATGVKFIRCKSVLDANGRFSPVFNDK